MQNLHQKLIYVICNPRNYSTLLEEWLDDQVLTDMTCFHFMFLFVTESKTPEA